MKDGKSYAELIKLVIKSFLTLYVQQLQQFDVFYREDFYFLEKTSLGRKKGKKNIFFFTIKEKNNFSLKLFFFTNPIICFPETYPFMYNV